MVDENNINEADYINDNPEQEVEDEMYSKVNDILGSIGNSNDCCCEVCKRISFDKCEDFKEVTVPVDMLNCQTRTLRVLVEIDNVCRNRLLATSVVITEALTNIILSQKGNIVFTGSSTSKCKKICKEFCFTLPSNMCQELNNLEIKVIANYILTNPLGSLTCDGTQCGGC